MKTRDSLIYFVTDRLWKRFFDSNWSQTTSNLVSLNILVTLKFLRLVEPKLRGINPFFLEGRGACVHWTPSIFF